MTESTFVDSATLAEQVALALKEHAGRIVEALLADEEFQDIALILFASSRWPEEYHDGLHAGLRFLSDGPSILSDIADRIALNDHLSTEFAEAQTLLAYHILNRAAGDLYNPMGGLLPLEDIKLKQLKQ